MSIQQGSCTCVEATQRPKTAALKMVSDWPVSVHSEQHNQFSHDCGPTRVQADPPSDHIAVVEEAHESLGRFTEITPLLPSTTPHELDNEIDGLTILREELSYLTKASLQIKCTRESHDHFGRLNISTKHLAGAALGSMTATVTGFGFINGSCSALDTVLPSAWTSSTPQLVGLWTQRMAVVEAAALVPIVILWTHAEPILLLLRQDPEFSKLAALYLRWMSLCLPSHTFNNLARRYFQSQGRFTIPTQIVMAGVPVNLLFNYLLVWGPEPIRLGFIGSPIAMSIATTFTSMLYIIYGLFFVPKTAWHSFSMRMFEKLAFLTRLGFAGFCQVASEWFAWEFSTMAASFLGPVAMASQSIIAVSSSNTWQAYQSLGMTISVRIGNLFGEQRAVRAKISAYATILLALVASMIWSTMYLTFKNSWARIFNNDPEVISLVASVLPFLALAQLFDGLGTAMAGVLRAQEKQLIGALLNISAYYFIGIPLGLWLTFSCHFGLKGTWVGLDVALVYLSLGTVFVCVKSDWNKELKKVQDRLAEDQKFMVDNRA